jgi:predicted transcriptional regulator
MKQRRDTSITVRLPLAMKRAVEREAEAERRSLSQMIVVVLEQFLESRHERPERNATTVRSKRTRPAARRS